MAKVIHEFVNTPDGNCAECGFHAQDQLHPQPSWYPHTIVLKSEKDLFIHGYATDHIWLMEDVDGFIGVRVDCGDSGTLYLTPSQATDLAEQLNSFVRPEVTPSGWMVNRATDYNEPEFFKTEQEAYDNAKLGVCDAWVTPLYKKGQ